MTIEQLNALLATSQTIIGLFKQGRQAWVDAHPKSPVPPELTDEYLINDLKLDAQALIKKGQALQAKAAGPS